MFGKAKAKKNLINLIVIVIDVLDRPEVDKNHVWFRGYVSISMGQGKKDVTPVQ